MEPTLARGARAGKARAIRLILEMTRDLPLATVNDLATHLPIGAGRISGDDKPSSTGCKAADRGELLLSTQDGRLDSSCSGVEGSDRVMRSLFRSLAAVWALAIFSASAQAAILTALDTNAFHGWPLPVAAAACALFLALTGFAAAERLRLTA
jgi:hypothetical protein